MNIERAKKRINHAFFGNPIEKHFLLAENYVLTARHLYTSLVLSRSENIHSKKADFQQ